MKICAVIPSYNHSEKLTDITRTLEKYGLFIIIVNDASDCKHALKLNESAAHDDNIHLISHRVNKGKGGAVITGLLAAKKLGYSHALQVDADGQHNTDDIKELIALAHNHPNALISGQPIYDDSIPKSRLFGRKITHFWVHIETLSMQIKDTMCGFRIYPLDATGDLLNKVKLGLRMDFDIEIMVRLFWRNVDVKFLPTSVHYPEDGRSHFRAFEDNVLISWLHTRLCFGMLIRAPLILMKRFAK